MSDQLGASPHASVRVRKASRPQKQETPSRREVHRRGDWRSDDVAARRWDGPLAASACAFLVAGLVLRNAIESVNGDAAMIVAKLVLWTAFLLPVIHAFSRGKPRGLLSCRSTDLLWGFAAGVLLRGLQGMLGGANSRSFPAAQDVSGQPFGLTVLNYFVESGLAAPLLEEFFFRGVLLVSIFGMFRARLGRTDSALIALLVTSGAFVLAHAGVGIMTLESGFQFFSVGACAALLVLLTGRIWGAILLHAVYNLSFLILLSVGHLAS